MEEMQAAAVAVKGRGVADALPGRHPLGKSEAVIKLHFRLGQGYGLGAAWRNYPKKKW